MARNSSGGRRSGRSQSGMFGRTSHRTGSVEFFTRPHTNPYLRVVGMVVRARAELTVIAVTLTAFFTLRAHIGPLQTTITVAVIVVVVFTVPVSRRYVIRRWWCVTTRHRMRACFAQTRTMTHNGRLPFLCWSRPSPVGERVRV